MKTRYLRRTLRVIAGLGVSAVGIVMMLQANIGLDPWNVFHQGIEKVTGISFGTATIIAGGLIILVSILMGESFGIGTLANIFCTGPIIDLILASNLIRQQTSFWPGLLMMLGGLEIIAIGTWLYMSAGLGSGPRDALMVALAKRLPWPVGVCRSASELLVTFLGWLMGGSVGFGTVLAAAGIGTFFQINFKLLRFQADQLHQETLAESFKNWKEAGEAV